MSEKKKSGESFFVRFAVGVAVGVTTVALAEAWRRARERRRFEELAAELEAQGYERVDLAPGLVEFRAPGMPPQVGAGGRVAPCFRQISPASPALPWKSEL